MSSGCMGDQHVLCGHDLDELRREGAIDITPDIECWDMGRPVCSNCGGPAAGQPQPEVQQDVIQEPEGGWIPEPPRQEEWSLSEPLG